MSSENRVNKYTCQDCGGHVFTIDTDEGTTPFMIRCRADLACGGMMESHFYQCEQDAVPTYEWRKPTPGEYRKSNSAMRDHFDKGGLNLYPINGPGLYPIERPTQRSRGRYLEWKRRWA